MQLEFWTINEMKNFNAQTQVELAQNKFLDDQWQFSSVKWP